MFPRLPVVVCALGVLGGCAAEQIDAEPEHPGGGAGATSASGSGGGGIAGSSSGGKPSMAGTGNVGGAPGTAGTSSGTAGTGSGTAGTSGVGGATGGTSGSGSGGGGTGGSGTTGGSAGKASTSLPFTEDFEDGQAQGFMPWNEDLTQGTWAIVADGAGKVYQPSAAVGDLEFAVGGSTAWTDVALKVKVRLADADSGAQIVLRFKEPKTYLVVEMAVGKYKLRGRAAGSTQDLISPSPKPTIVAGTWYTVGIVAKGTTVSLTLDGQPIGASAMCNALISNGGVALGVAEGSVAFDDLNVTAAP
jgi:hypothetical protein